MCIFCKIIAGELPADKVYESEQVIVFLSINPINKGHLLVVPKKHYNDILDTPDELLFDLIQVAKRVAQVIKKVTGADGVNLGVNNGMAAGQVIFHTHLHVIPRFKNDGLKSWPDKEYENDEEKSELALKIKKELE